ncbi:MAG: hypothetical protein P1U64_01160 [Alcanivoracaceae bacterium]|jgi:hypothetical protein|nr:hypothetical protein [Alcanivoracaceae bacterium]
MKTTRQAIIGMLLMMMAGTALSDEGTVIISRDCDYLLLDSTRGQVLIKVIKGEAPKQGDRLSGDLSPRDFAELTNGRTGEVVGVWVDLVDRTASKALMRFSQYCP